MAELAFTLPTVGEPASFALSKSGGVAVAACRDEKLRVWVVAQPRLLHTMELAGREVDVTAVSGDGRWILIADHKGGVTIWNCATGEVHMQLRLPPYPWPAVFSRDGKTLGVAPMGRAVQVFEVSERRKRFELEHPVGGTAGLSFSRDGTRIATVDGDCVVRVYDMADGKLLARNDDSLMIPLAVDFTADGRHVVVGGGDKVTAYIDAATGKVARRMDRDAEPPLSLQVSADGRHLAVVFFKADDMLAAAPVVVWDVEPERRKVEWMPPAMALGAGWTDDGRLLAGVAGKGGLQIWRVFPA